MRPEHWLYTIPLRLRSLFRWAQADRELDDELRDHLERKTEEYVARGLAPEEARRRARLDLEGIEQTKEKCRDARRVNWIQDLLQDLHYGLRILRKSPSFTAVAVLTLALGIGANTAIFSLMDNILLRALPVHEPRQLVEISREGGGTLSYPAFEVIQAPNQVFTGALCLAGGRFDAGVNVDGQAMDIHNSLVSDNYFRVLGIKPALGGFLDDGDVKNSDRAVISYGLWERAYGRETSVLGKTLRIGDRSYSIIGVAPRDFGGVTAGQSVDCWLPLPVADNPMFKNPFAFVLRIIARLKPGVTVTRASANMEVLSAQLKDEWKMDEPLRLELTPASAGLSQLRRRFSHSLIILQCLVGLILMIVCVNVSNLQLARGSARHREMAVRISIGASRLRLLRQFFTESILLAICGGVLGVLFAYWASSVLVSLMSTAGASVELAFPLDVRVLAFTLVVSLCASVLFGLAPAISAARRDPMPTLKGGSEASDQRWAYLRPGRLLIIAEIAVSSVLLVGAVLFVRSLSNLEGLNPGFDPNHLLLLRIGLRPDLKGVQREQAYKEVLGRLSSVPGVRSVSLSSESLFQGNSWTEAISTPSYHPRRGEDQQAHILIISPEYFETMRTPLLRGREFGPQDHENSQPAAIVNEAMVQRFFPGLDPISQSFSIESQDFPVPLNVVGVAKDTKYKSLREPAPSIVYLPMRQALNSLGEATIEVRTDASSKKMKDVFWREAQGTSPLVRVTGATEQAEFLDSSIAQDRLLAILSGCFGAIALVLVSMGIYGVTSYTVSRRTPEIGLRLALGAQPVDVQKLVLGHGARLVLAGATIGVIGAATLTGVIASMLFEVRPVDPVTYFAVALLLAAVTLLACYVPARRAATIDPMVALRYE